MNNMRLNVSKNAAEETIVRVLNDGYRLLNWLKADYIHKIQTSTYSAARDLALHKMEVDRWASGAISALNAIFPTELEANQFLHPPTNLRAVVADTPDEYQAKRLRSRVDDLLRGLEQIRQSALPRYTDLPVASRLYVEDIDSFAKVRDVNPDAVGTLLKQNGFFDVSEEFVQRGLETILNEPFHKKDWGGEYNDLYTSNVLVNGLRRAAAFLLKGNGLQTPSFEIKHCGKNGDQLVRLFESPADLFLVQYVGNVSEAVIKDVEGKIDQLKMRGKTAAYCIINGLDTARLLKAYGIG